MVKERNYLTKEMEVMHKERKRDRDKRFIPNEYYGVFFDEFCFKFIHCCKTYGLDETLSDLNSSLKKIMSFPSNKKIDGLNKIIIK